MKICDKPPVQKEPEVVFIPGHLYQWDEIYLAINSEDIVLLKTGQLFTKQKPGVAIDVTNKYCLQRIEK